MENRIIALNAQLEMNNELLKNEHKMLISKVEDAVNNFICNPHGAVISRKNLRIGLWDEIEIQFEIGFYNETENRIDFGSDVWFEYNTKKNELALNYGTIGTYTKSDIYQVKRVNLIADVFAHITEIEAELAAIAEFADNGNYRAYLKEEYKIESEISQIQKEIEAQQIKEIEYSLKEGDTLKYSDDVRYNSQLFHTHTGAWSIHKICEKTIKVKSPYFGEIRQFPKERIVKLIHQGHLMVNAKEDIDE